MRALVIYESMFGNTHEVAERIGAGLRVDFEVEVIPVHDAVERDLAEVDLLVVGGPTHAHSMSRHSTRSAAVKQAASDQTLELEPAASEVGLRDWFEELPRGWHGCAAAFDTRAVGPELLTGSAARGIARQLTKHGFELVSTSESFLVDRQNRLVVGEADRAEAWGEALTIRVPI